MIGLILAAAASATTLPPCVETSCTTLRRIAETQEVIDVLGGADAGVCGYDVNRPDLAVCIEGAERRIRLFLPYPPCGTPEAKAAPKCVEWKIGAPP